MRSRPTAAAALQSPDLSDWLPEDHVAWSVIKAIEQLHLEPFYGACRSDGHGRAAYEPKTMLTPARYSYRVGERSSRGIERRCRENVAFRVICANRAPDHATIARFRVRHQETLADLCGQVLDLCAEAGLVEVAVLAVDGSKFEASASNHASRSYEQIAKEILAEAGQIDAAEDELYGDARIRYDKTPDSYLAGLHVRASCGFSVKFYVLKPKGSCRLSSPSGVVPTGMLD